MDQYFANIESKMSKLENSCSNLNEEIFITLSFILRLKENFAEIVRKLNSVTTPDVFLKEFVNVHSLILKYQSFLTEINCKFEMLEISEMRTNKLYTNNKAIVSKEALRDLNKLDIDLNCKSSRDLKFTNNDGVLKNIAVEQHLKSDLLFKKSFKKKSKKKKHTASSEAQSNVKSLSYEAQNSGNNCNESKIICKSTVKNAHKENLDEKIEMKSSSGLPLVQPEKVQHPDNVDTNISSILKVCRDQNDQNKVQQKSFTEDVVDFVESDNFSDKFHYNKTHSPIRSVVKAEVLPTETECSPEALNEDEKNDIKPANIVKKLGTEYGVVIEHIKSPSEFYVSLIDNQPDLFVELEKKLKSIPQSKKKYCSKKDENRKTCLNKEIGNYALFYSKCDEMWYRVKIINWCLNLMDDYVSIFLIDYGETKCVTIDDLQPMPEDLKKYPAFTQRCHLFGIFPLDMDKNCETLSWHKESTEKMRYLTENSKKVKIKIGPDDCYHPLTSLPVTLWLVDQGDQCVNELLVKSKYAIAESAFNQGVIKTKTMDTYFTEIADLYNWNPMKEDFESFKNSYDLDIKDPAAHIYGYVGKDYERICLHFARTGHCFKGQACKKKHQKLDPLGFTTDQEEVFNNAFNSLSVPPPNSVLDVRLTCLLTFNRFCCISNSSSFSFDEENLQTLLKFMNKPENVLQMKKLLIPPSAGQIVIARYSEDRSWYRARILDSDPENDLYRVVFVDYGNKEVVPLTNIRAIEARYLHLPFQAIHCFIFGIDRNPKVSLNDVMDYINKRMSNGHISIEVIAKLPGEDVSLLVNVFDQNGRNIGQDLIENKYAIHKQEMIISSETKSMPG